MAASHDYPCYCTDAKFDVAALPGSLRPLLAEFWPTLYPGKNEDFWKHEYEKHGTCYSPRNQTAFFTSALDTLFAYDPLKRLARHGLAPRSRPFALRSSS